MIWASYILAALVAVLTIIQIWWDYLLKYFFKDGRTNEHKKLRKGLLIVALTLFILNQAASVITRYGKDQQAKIDKIQFFAQVSQLTNQLSVITAVDVDLEHQLSQLNEVVRTSTEIPIPIRLAALNSELAQNSNEQSLLAESHKLFSPESIDIKTLRAQENIDSALQESQRRQEALRHAIEDINAKQDRENRAQYQQLKDRGLIKSEKILAAQILPIFNYTLERLGTRLEEYSTETGLDRRSDFSGGTPTVYASNLTKDGIITSGSNYISLGTNSAWRFIISTAVTLLQTSPTYLLPNQELDNSIIFHEPFVTMKITCLTTNGESTFIIMPYHDWRPDIYPSPQPLPAPVADRLYYPQVSIQLHVPSRPDIDELQSSTNYMGSIDEMLRHLVEAQDAQSKLESKAAN